MSVAAARAASGASSGVGGVVGSLANSMAGGRSLNNAIMSGIFSPGNGNIAARGILGYGVKNVAGAVTQNQEPVSNDPEYLSSANSAYDDAYKAMMDNQGPGGRANAQSSGLRSAFNDAKSAREAARFRFKAEQAGMSPEEYNNDQINRFGGIQGQNNVSRFGTIRNNVNADFNSVVGSAQESYTDNPSDPSEEKSNLRNPLGQELEPMMNAVGFKNSAISNAGKMFGNTYGSLFAGAAKKYEGPAHCNVDTMHTMYWNDMRKRNKTKKQ